MPPHRSSSEGPSLHQRSTPYSRTARSLSPWVFLTSSLLPFVLSSDLVSPVDTSGNPIEPKKLEKYIIAHDCPTPVCACGFVCRFINVKTGEHSGKTAIACGAGYGCGFWVTLEDLLYSSDGGIIYGEYPVHGYGSRAIYSYLSPFKHVGTPASSSSKSSPASKLSEAASTPESDFSWSPVRRLLQMKASPSPLAQKTDVFDKDNAYTSRGNLFSGDSPSSSTSSAGIGPISTTKYRFFDTGKLPKPTHPHPGDKKLTLWSPPSVKRLVKSIGAKAPEHGVLSPTGSTIEDFWTVWGFCAGCEHVVAAAQMGNHICDLTKE
ncbi:hypothetical protein FB451DRAFT_1372415 [Mycena latifolia]|nr:hypothetical protein FB451DRAFT_1372415 [Mycena latifolia]